MKYDLPGKNPKNLDPQEQRNFLIAIVLMFAVITAFNIFYEKPRMDAVQEQQAAEQVAVEEAATIVEEDTPQPIVPRREALAQTRRLEIATPNISGSLSTTGFRIDDVRLNDYYETLEKENNVAVLSPSVTEEAFYAEFGWLAKDKAQLMPGPDTRWQQVGPTVRLTPKTPVTLTWDNGQGLVFEREITVDESYVFHVTQRVRNLTDTTQTVYSYGLVSRRHDDENDKNKQQTMMMHEGAIGYIDQELEEYGYSKIRKKGLIEHTLKSGWVGFGDKYWFAGLIPEPGKTYAVRFTHHGEVEDSRFQVDLRSDGIVIAPGAAAETALNFYAGAKELSILETYEDKGFAHFDLVVDFGWLYFLTKPFMYVLHYLTVFFGHFAIAMVVFTVLLRLVLFPMAYTSSKTMAKMKVVQPKMKELQEKHGDDREKLQKEIYALYSKEGVNPFHSCWPQIIQIILFLALYKVLMVTVDMRHVPFWGWVSDMAEPDPSHIGNLFGLLPWQMSPWLETHSIFNLYGLLPFEMRDVTMIGAWPCMMAIAMHFTQRLYPPPPDPTMAFYMRFLPFVIAFIFAKFPAGLAIYYTLSNTITFIQQYVIMKKMGAPVSLFNKTTGPLVVDLDDSKKSDPDPKPKPKSKSKTKPKKK